MSNNTKKNSPTMNSKKIFISGVPLKYWIILSIFYSPQKIGLMSPPTKFLFVSTHASKTKKLPAAGSNTKSPSTVVALISRVVNPMGFLCGCPSRGLSIFSAITDDSSTSCSNRHTSRIARSVQTSLARRGSF